MCRTIQKRMGNRLQQLKNSMRKKKLADRKPLSGKGRLTDSLINQLTIYYGKAIRDNKDSIAEIHKAIWATIFHKRSNDNEPLHDFYPAGPTSWSIQKSKANNTLKELKHKHIMPIPIIDCIKEISRTCRIGNY